MSNPTSNFNWQMPTATDLVTDLPADFEVFGQAVDTSLADLRGGTTNQILAKNSNTDMDFKWVSDATGMTNPMTTTGDTIYSSSGSTPARLGIGSTGQVLTVSGGVPAWTTPTATTPAFVGCIVRDTAQQAITTATQTTITFNTDVIDTNGFHDTSTNTSRFTVPTGYAGKYRIVYNTRFGTTSATGEKFWELYLNGTNIYAQGLSASAGATFFGYGLPVSIDLTRDLAVGDWVELQVYHNAGVNQDFIRTYNGSFTFQFLGA
jgi:hypothetical protein